MPTSKSFLFYLDNKEILEILSDAQLGQLLRHLIDFAETGIKKEIEDPAVFMAYRFMTAQMQRDMEKYEQKCRKNAENARKGGAPKGNQNAIKNKLTETSERLKKQPKQPYTDKDTETDTNTETDIDISVKPTRHKYGEYKNVLLSDEDMQKLQAEFPYDWQERIERLSEYMASTGKSYKDHLATIRTWARKDGNRQQTTSNTTIRSKPPEGNVQVLNGVFEILE